MLLRKKSMKAVKLLRKHIEAGCLSDPEGVAMYYAVGKTKDGLIDYRCVRGTNDVEVRYFPLDLRWFQRAVVNIGPESYTEMLPSGHSKIFVAC